MTWKPSPPPLPPTAAPSRPSSGAAALRGAAARLEARRRPGGGSAPEERGERLATLSRNEGVEVRITWDQYKGSPFLGLREWMPGTDGMYPTKKGVTVRVSELPALANALADALDRAEAHAATRGAR
jgi:hypothetical protein